jgi:hypothetical protein
LDGDVGIVRGNQLLTQSETDPHATTADAHTWLIAFASTVSACKHSENITAVFPADAAAGVANLNHNGLSSKLFPARTSFALFAFTFGTTFVQLAITPQEHIRVHRSGSAGGFGGFRWHRL